MTDQSTGTQHILLDEVRDPRLAAYRAQRDRAEAFVGEYIVTWNLLDYFLSMTIAHRTNSGRHPSLEVFMRRLGSADKIALLASILPAGWHDGQRLIEHLRDGNQFRNALAHGGLAQSGMDAGKHFGWHLWNLRGKSNVLELTQQQQRMRLASVAVVQQAVALLLDDEFLVSAGELNDRCLGDAIIQRPGVWRTRGDREAFVAGARSMFSCASSQ